MKSRRWWRYWLALGVGVLGAAAGVTARAGIDDAETAPPPALDATWMIQIPPQATVTLDDSGNIASYEDPADPSMTCRSVLECWGILAPRITGIGIFSVQSAEEFGSTAAPPSESSP